MVKMEATEAFFPKLDQASKTLDQYILHSSFQLNTVHLYLYMKLQFCTTKAECSIYMSSQAEKKRVSSFQTGQL